MGCGHFEVGLKDGFPGAPHPKVFVQETKKAAIVLREHNLFKPKR